VVDILKITSAIPAANRVDNLPKQLPGDAVFDINSLEETPRYRITEQQKGGDDPREALLRNLNNEIFTPLKADLTAQMEVLKKLVLFLRFFEDPSLAGKLGGLDELFLKPQELLDALMGRDKDATVFKGELFDALRVLAKAEGFPKLQEAIVNLLRAFDSNVNGANTQRAIFMQTAQFAAMLKEGDAQQLTELLGRMETLMGKEGHEAHRQMSAFLKNELLPLLSSMAGKYQFQGGERLQNRLMSIIHQVVRFDKADIRLLEQAMAKLGDELKSFGRLTDDDVTDMRRTLFSHLREAKAQAAAREGRPAAQGQAGDTAGAAADKNIAELISRAMDTGAATKANSAAQNMLAYMIENESPVFALMHFLFPIKYQGAELYSEVYVDKDCRERDRDGGDAKNIFFIIQSDKYGSFEVDLLVRERAIDLDIRCPDMLEGDVKAMRTDLRAMMDELGYRLASYNVGIYREDRNIMQRFPKLAMRKAGIDVRI
jgi:hypothetical protein